jgi:hypothetical protein
MLVSFERLLNKIKDSRSYMRFFLDRRLYFMFTLIIVNDSDCSLIACKSCLFTEVSKYTRQ